MYASWRKQGFLIGLWCEYKLIYPMSRLFVSLFQVEVSRAEISLPNVVLM